MSKANKASCDNCYFRQAGLCALPEAPCPTYRPAGRGALSPPRQARLVPMTQPYAPATAA